MLILSSHQNLLVTLKERQEEEKERGKEVRKKKLQSNISCELINENLQQNTGTSNPARSENKSTS